MAVFNVRAEYISGFPFDFTQGGESFDFAQDRESFDVAQDREPVERPVEPPPSRE